ncbi:AI-2E family transporter [Nocardioides sp. Arc9.136]|uniref:AI-2E family transporter n=1 Tax=Nocardioides sp. Arc9.136 TaxID=2996826 RepID=UPI0026651CEC|nr:AI-2E family transporter [Nocardioides sp. Arc9.136]WKN49556.1 AI-2E family transporter [Nocardioides sp. Arc9.136]
MPPTSPDSPSPDASPRSAPDPAPAPSSAPLAAASETARQAGLATGLTWLATWSWRWVGVALAAVVLGWLVGVLWVALLPAFLALILASVLQPASELLTRRTRVPRGLAAGLVMLAALAVIAGGVAAIAPSVTGQGDEIVSDASEGIDQLRDWAVEKELISQDQVDTAVTDARDRLGDSAGSIASGVLVGVNAVSSGLVTLALTLVLTFLYLKDGHRFRPWAAGVTGPRVGRHLDQVLDQVWTTLGGFVRTQAIVSLVDAVLIGIALAVVGVPLAVPLAVLTFFGGFVPILGAFVVGGLAVLVALVSVGIEGALVVLAAIIVVQQLEGNVLQPWLQSRAMQLHAGVVILAVTVGSTLFGIAGAFLAVPVAAMVAVVLRYLSTLADPAPPLTPPAPDEDAGAQPA